MINITTETSTNKMTGTVRQSPGEIPQTAMSTPACVDHHTITLGHSLPMIEVRTHGLGDGSDVGGQEQGETRTLQAGERNVVGSSQTASIRILGGGQETDHDHDASDLPAAGVQIPSTEESHIKNISPMAGIRMLRTAEEIDQTDPPTAGVQTPSTEENHAMNNSPMASIRTV